jgi:hypothetical protein
MWRLSMKAVQLEIGVLRLSGCEEIGRKKDPEEVLLPLLR